MSEVSKVEDGQIVSLEYSLLVDGELMDSSVGHEPLEFLQGVGNIIPGLENELYGMAVGESKKVTVSAADGYGELDPDAYADVPRADFPENIPAEVGTELQVQDEHGQPMYARIDLVTDDVIRLDFNHPLAGKELNFDEKSSACARPARKRRSTVTLTVTGITTKIKSANVKKNVGAFFVSDVLHQNHHHKHGKQGAGKVHPVIIQPAPAAQQGGRRAAGVQGVAFGFFLTIWAKINRLRRRAEKTVEERAEKTGQRDPDCQPRRNRQRGEQGGQPANQRRPGQGSQRANQRNAARGAFFHYFQRGNQARRMRVEYAQFRRPGVGVDGGQRGRKRRPNPNLTGEEKPQPGEKRRQAAVAKNLPGIALTAFGKFLAQAALAGFEGAAERAGGDEKCQQQRRPAPATDTKHDSANQRGGQRARAAEAARAKSGQRHQNCEKKSGQKLCGHSGVVTMKKTASKNDSEESAEESQTASASGRSSSRR